MLDINKIATKQNYTFPDLVQIMKILRAKDIGCPWDIEQNHKTIRNNFIEEAYEAVEGIDTGNDDLLCEELGDVLLQVVFHAEIAENEGSFNIDDVADGICKKLILRHPHVFGSLSVADADEVLDNWEKIKLKEKNQKTLHKAIDDIAKTMPSLMRVQKIRKKCEKASGQSSGVESSIKSIEKELENIRAGRTSPECISEILCSVCDIARINKIDAEQALYDKCESLIKDHEI
ncbi:MAG: nucleoside triphosphate pyrophosphohydrolase [Clostridiales bacterium]|nr:MAG: nucleoside triphosphate pyrophosphohydrolase [Clostridiales bacterium]